MTTKLSDHHYTSPPFESPRDNYPACLLQDTIERLVMLTDTGGEEDAEQILVDEITSELVTGRMSTIGTVSILSLLTVCCADYAF